MDIENVAKTQLDTRLAKAKPIKLGWSADETERISSALNELLANYQVHYQKLRNYHWNVKGGDFFDLHQEFETLYTEANQNIDDLEHSAIKETGTDLPAEVMAREVLSDFRILLGYLVNVLSIASEQEDAGTEQIIKGYIKRIEKHHWMLTAYLAK
jgi:starvation-inducible DNA-binding protein